LELELEVQVVMHLLEQSAAVELQDEGAQLVLVTFVWMLQRYLG
jgi:hypothetical protein